MLFFCLFCFCTRIIFICLIEYIKFPIIFISILYFKIVQSEHFIYWIQHSNWLFLSMNTNLVLQSFMTVRLCLNFHISLIGLVCLLTYAIGHWLQKVIFVYWSACTRHGEWRVLYMSDRVSKCVPVYKKIRFKISATIGPSWSWSYCSWIYNYLCNKYLSPLKLWARIALRSGVLDTTLGCACVFVLNKLQINYLGSPL
jgi:hypothetical protein